MHRPRELSAIYRSQPMLRHGGVNNTIAPFTETSHSELGAARDSISDAVDHLRGFRIQLPTTRMAPNRNDGWFHNCFPLSPLGAWKSAMKRVVDVVIPFTISLPLIEIFVTESAGIVLSANIVSDTLALSTPSSYSASSSWDTKATTTRALAYTENRYHAPSVSEGCNVFYNQSIGYHEQSEDT